MAEMAENTLKEIESDLTKIVEPVPEKYQDAVSFVLVKSFNELIQSEVVANFLADAFNVSVGAATVNPTSLALTQIKKKIDDLQKDVDKLLRSDMETAQENFKMAVNYFQSKETQHLAYKEFGWVMKKANEAFPKVKGFESQLTCKQLSITSRILRDIFDEDTKQFKPFSTLSLEKRRTIGLNVKTELENLIKAKQAAEGDIPWYRKVTTDQKSGERQKIQDQLDPLLKFCLPYLWVCIKDLRHDAEELIQLVPEGFSACATVGLDNGTDIVVWKNPRKNMN